MSSSENKKASIFDCFENAELPSIHSKSENAPYSAEFSHARFAFALIPAQMEALKTELSASARSTEMLRALLQKKAPWES